MPPGASSNPRRYHALVDGRGWSHDEWIEWTVSAVSEQIFGRGPS